MIQIYAANHVALILHQHSMHVSERHSTRHLLKKTCAEVDSYLVFSKKSVRK